MPRILPVMVNLNPSTDTELHLMVIRISHKDILHRMVLLHMEVIDLIVTSNITMDTIMAMDMVIIMVKVMDMLVAMSIAITMAMIMVTEVVIIMVIMENMVKGTIMDRMLSGHHPIKPMVKEMLFVHHPIKEIRYDHHPIVKEIIKE